MAEKANPSEAAAAAAKLDSEILMTKRGTKVRNLGGLVSIIAFVLSLPVLASVVWLLYMKDYDCEILLRLPKLQVGIGIVMILVFLISNAVVFFRYRFPVPGFFLVMVPLVVVFIIGLALVGAWDMESRKIIATPMWFKDKVRDNSNWENIKSCIFETKACEDFISRSLTLQPYDFSLKKFSFLESGCCRPPAICEMEYVNATFWRKRHGTTKNESRSYNEDCDTWQNDENVLCYDCNSCKEGFVSSMESKWWKLGIFLIVMAFLLIISHVLLFVAVMLEHYNG